MNPVKLLPSLTACDSVTCLPIRTSNYLPARPPPTSQIYCTHNMPNWSLPWQRLKQEQSTSTGFVIDGRRIITNAHAVEYSTMIQVK